MNLVSSTGESLRLRKSFPICSMEAKASSVSLMLKRSFPCAGDSEGTDVGDHERDAELILRADLAKVDAAVFEGETAAAAVVTGLDDLVCSVLLVKS